MTIALTLAALLDTRQPKAASANGSCLYNARGISVSLRTGRPAAVRIQGRSMRGSTFTEIHVLKAANEPAKFFIEPMLTGVSHTNCTVDEIADPTDITLGAMGKSGFIAVHVDSGVAFIIEGAAIEGDKLSVRGWVERRAFGARGVRPVQARIYIRSQAGSDSVRDISGNDPGVATLEMPVSSKSGCAEVGLLESEPIPQARVCW